jgi:antitoxin CcdA
MSANARERIPFDRSAPRRAVNLSLNVDLVSRAKTMTRNLSATVEDLLADFVEREQARQRADDAALERVLDALNEVHAKHGFLSDEFQSF